MKCKSCKYNKFLYCLVALFIFLLSMFLIKQYFKPFFVIIIMLFVCTPIYNLLCNFKIFNNKISALITILIVNFIIVAFLVYIGNYIYSIRDILFKKVFELIDNIEQAIKFLNISSLDKELQKYEGIILNSKFVTKGALYTTDSIINYFIGNIMTYFILADKYVILNWITNLMPKNVLSVMKDKLQDGKSILKIEISLVCLTTIQTIIGLKILNIDNYLALGILSGILDILPYVGTILVFGPLTIYYFFIKNYIIGFGILCLYILLVVMRQIMEAKFISNKLKVHPLPTILSMYIGLKIFGLFGMLLAPIYIIICKSILDSN